MPPTLNLAGFTKEYVIEIPELDEQHETFFSMLDKIADVTPDLYKVLDEDESDALADVITDLREYALLHFRTEEGYMKEVDYPELDQQKQAHNKFITDIIRMEADIMNGTAIPAIKVRNFMHDWYRDHILALDKPFSVFYRENK